MAAAAAPVRDLFSTRLHDSPNRLSFLPPPPSTTLSGNPDFFSRPRGVRSEGEMVACIYYFLRRSNFSFTIRNTHRHI